MTQTPERLVPAAVEVLPARVHAAIDLDDELQLWTEEVHDEAPDDDLPAKGHAEPLAGKLAPKPSGDVGRFFARAVEAPDVDFAVLYAVGRGGERLFDMQPTRRLIGFEARDRWPEGLGFELPDGAAKA